VRTGTPAEAGRVVQSHGAHSHGIEMLLNLGDERTGILALYFQSLIDGRQCSGRKAYVED
jgi:hypothetical protein